MSTLNEDIVSVLTAAKISIQDNMQKKGINASGRTSAALDVRKVEGGYQLHKRDGDNAPIESLEVGHDGRNLPRGFFDIVRKWSVDKGLQFNTEAERGAFAYFTALKIEREGTRRYKQHEDVYTSVVKDLQSKIAEIAKNYVSDFVKTEVKMSLHG